MDACLKIESDTKMVGPARRFVRDRLVAWETPEQVDAAVLVASELVTNAVLHARTEIVLRLSMEGSSLRLEVYDGNPRLPAPTFSPPSATSGRGLVLVDAIASSWGIDHRRDGKVVWAEVGSGTGGSTEDCLDLSGVDTVEQAVDAIRLSQPDTQGRSSR